MMPKIIGISGKIGSGKSTLAKIIKDILGEQWEIKSFAYKLKQIASILTGIPTEDFAKQEIKDAPFGIEWRRGGWKQKGFIDLGAEESVTYRHLLQILGTEVVRDIHPNAWINALFADYKLGDDFVDEPISKKNKEKFPIGYAPKSQRFYKEKTYPNWIIDDVRFPNEAEAIKKRGGIVIRINRPKSLLEEAKKGAYTLTKEGLAPTYPEHSSETALDSYKFDYTIDNSKDLDYLKSEIKKNLLPE